MGILRDLKGCRSIVGVILGESSGGTTSGSLKNESARLEGPKCSGLLTKGALVEVCRACKGKFGGFRLQTIHLNPKSSTLNPKPLESYTSTPKFQALNFLNDQGIPRHGWQMRGRAASWPAGESGFKVWGFGVGV